MKKIWLFTLLFAFLSSGCAMDKSNMKRTFEQTYKGYNKLIRWSEPEMAVLKYSLPENREDDLKKVEQLKKRGVSIVDYRILANDLKLEDYKADTITEFDYFIMPSNVIKTYRYTQEWVYKEVNKKKSWKIKNKFPDFL